MTFDEMKRLVRIFVHHGVDRLRITGGEPLVRPGLLTFLNEISTEFPDLRLLMTTNGLLLEKFASEIIHSKIETINVSLDTLDPLKFKSITGSNKINSVLRGIKSIKKNSNIKIKVNCVSLKDFNDSKADLKSFIEFAKEFDVIIRFIEFMPFSGNDWNKDRFVSSEVLRNIIEEDYTLIKETVSHISQTSRIYTIKENDVKLGFISSVSESFCEWCNRLRITADGNLRACLHSSNETNLSKLMRDGKTDEYISDIIKKAVYNKPAGHKEFLSPTYFSPDDDREMIRIGG
jgi:cyclic pyranopterin phosphate synthase